jgi:hypothetical protein
MVRKATSFPQTGSLKNATVLHCLFKGGVGCLQKCSEDGRRAGFLADFFIKEKCGSCPFKNLGTRVFLYETAYNCKLNIINTTLRTYSGGRRN